MMRLNTTFAHYIGREYLKHFLVFILILLAIVLMFDFIELLRRASRRDIPMGLVLQLALLKLPEVGQQLFSFAILFSAIFTFWRLTRSNELVVARAAGMSAWQFLAPVIFVALSVGLFKVTILNPVSAAFLSKYERLEAENFGRRASLVDIQGNGLWLRQDDDNSQTGQDLILFARGFDPQHWHFNDVTFFYMGEQGQLTRRIDAERTTIEKGFWSVTNARIHTFDGPADLRPAMEIPTSLTRSQIEESFASPSTISFWKLADFIEKIEQTGFSATRLKIYYYALMVQPFLFIAMVLLAASVSMRPPRRGWTFAMMVSGVVIGFAVFMFDNFLRAYGLSENIPPFVAAFATPAIAFAMGLTALLFQEDG